MVTSSLHHNSKKNAHLNYYIIDSESTYKSVGMCKLAIMIYIIIEVYRIYLFSACLTKEVSIAYRSYPSVVLNLLSKIIEKEKLILHHLFFAVVFWHLLRAEYFPT